MGREELARILGRAALDTRYLEILKADPKRAAIEARVDLTTADVKALKAMDFKALERFHSGLKRMKTVAFFDKKDN